MDSESSALGHSFFVFSLPILPKSRLYPPAAAVGSFFFFGRSVIVNLDVNIKNASGCGFVVFAEDQLGCVSKQKCADGGRSEVNDIVA
jgi:hypothetical protein